MMAFLMGLPTLSPTQLRELLARDAATVYDVNAPASWNKARIPGAGHGKAAPGHHAHNRTPSNSIRHSHSASPTALTLAAKLRPVT